MTSVRGAKVGIIGGSIAGCAAATALSRLGCEVEIFERSARTLRDRGSGIALPGDLERELKEAGYLPTDHHALDMTHRAWMLADGSPCGRQLWLQRTGHARAQNWGLLWQALRENVPDAVYRAGVALEGFSADADGVTAGFSDGAERRLDLLVAADGYRSAVRTQLTRSVPQYAGYILWRGNYPESRVGGSPQLKRVSGLGGWSTICFPGGQGVYYPIPDVDGGRRVNWAIYAPKPPELVLDGPASVPPGAVDGALYAHLDALLTAYFPPDHAALVRQSPPAEVSIQPIYDEEVDHYVHGRVALIGDAGTVTRPHTGSGATKALRDARCLELLGQAHDDLDDLLAAYGQARSEAGRTLVRVGKNIGRGQVEDTPPWDRMTPADFERWTAGMLAGDSLYLFDDGEHEGRTSA